MYRCSRPGPAQQSARLTRSRPRHSETRYPIGQYISTKLLIGQNISNKLLIGQCISNKLLIGQYISTEIFIGQYIGNKVLIGQYISNKLLIGQYISNKLLIGQCISTKLLIGRYSASAIVRSSEGLVKQITASYFVENAESVLVMDNKAYISFSQPLFCQQILLLLATKI
jgi:hypothetical protein